MASVLPRHVFSVEEWEEMGRLGLFDEDARVELIDGEIVDMTPIGARHQDCMDRRSQALGITPDETSERVIPEGAPPVKSASALRAESFSSWWWSE